MQKTRFNPLKRDWKLKPEYCETPVGESLTVPDETLTIREIVEKHVRGQRIADTLMRTPVYNESADFDDEDIEKLRDSDLYEREEIKQMHKQKIEDFKEKQKNFFSEKQKKEKKGTRASEGAGEDVGIEDVDEQETRPKNSARKATQKDDRREDEKGAKSRGKPDE